MLIQGARPKESDGFKRPLQGANSLEPGSRLLRMCE